MAKRAASRGVDGGRPHGGHHLVARRPTRNPQGVTRAQRAPLMQSTEEMTTLLMSIARSVGAAFLAASTQGPSRRRPCLRSGSSTTRGCRSCSRTRACRSRAVERGCTDRLGANLLSFCIQQLVRRVGSTDAVESDAAAVTLGRPPAPGDDYCIFLGDADADGAVPQPAARLEATGAALPSSAASAALLDGFGIRCRATA